MTMRFELPPIAVRPIYFASMFVSLLFAICSARVTFVLLTTVFLPEASAADGGPLPIIALNAFDFSIACAIGAAGGLVTFYQESLRLHWPGRPILFAAIGHLMTAMFAAVLAYLGSIYFQLPEVAGWVASGMAGFAGYVGLKWAQNLFATWVEKRMGLAPAEVPIPPQEPKT